MTTSDVSAPGVDDRALRSLRVWNLALTVLHLAQAIAVAVLATDFAITITRSLPTGPPGSTNAFAGSVSSTCTISAAIARVPGACEPSTTCSPPTALRRTSRVTTSAPGINRFRWVEYSFSATLMVVLIALYAGIVDISALIGIIGANVSMILFGWLPGIGQPARQHDP